MKEMPIRPLFDKLLVKPDGSEEKSKGGIHIPEAVQVFDRPNTGTVVSAGAGKKNADGSRRPLEVKTGDKVMFVKNAGSTIKLEGGEFLMLTEDDILAVLG